MSFVTKCWWKAARSGRSRKARDFAAHGQEIPDRSGPIRREATPRAAGGEKVGARLEALLTESTEWTGGKQQLTATRLHELLVAEGHHVGVTLVRSGGGRVAAAATRGVCAVDVSSRRLAEVDFFEVLVDLDGVRRKAWLFLMRLIRRPRLRVDLRAAGPSQLSRRPCPRVYPLWWRAGPRGIRQSACGGGPDPGRGRACPDAAVCGARRITCLSRAFVDRVRATIRAASKPAGRRSAGKRWCRFRAGRRWTRSMPRCSRDSMRSDHDGGDERALRRGAQRVLARRPRRSSPRRRPS